jgi:hypothetical protein
MWNRWVPHYFFKKEKEEITKEEAAYKAKCQEKEKEEMVSAY